MHIDQSIGSDYSVAMTYALDINNNYDIIWGYTDIREYSMKLPLCYYRRIKPWMALPLTERIRFMNMRRQNKAYNFRTSQHIVKKGVKVYNGKFYQFVDILNDHSK